MAAFLDVDLEQVAQVVERWRGLAEIALLLDGRVVASPLIQAAITDGAFNVILPADSLPMSVDALAMPPPLVAVLSTKVLPVTASLVNWNV